MNFWSGVTLVLWMALAASIASALDRSKLPRAMTSLQIQQCTKGDRQ